MTVHAGLSGKVWTDELERVVTQSLFTSFGLDFMLLEDKKGGDVDTIHNVRRSTHASETERERYENRPAYDRGRFSSGNYVKRGQRDKLAMLDGTLEDAYRKTEISPGDARDLDHVISAKEIHDDPGRVLAELGGVNLANRDSNLQSTTSSINRAKKERSVSKFIEDRPRLVAQRRATLEKRRAQLESAPRVTPEQRHCAEQLEAKIRKDEHYLAAITQVDEDAMRERDAVARAEYDREISRTYYTSSKFYRNSALASAGSGLRMGLRQMLGMVAAEVWFELRDALPRLYARLQRGFDLRHVLAHIKRLLAGIWKRVKRRFKAFIESFADGFFSGVAASLTNTAINVLATTSRVAGKLLRECWVHVTKALKLFVWNPERLSWAHRYKAVISIVAGAVGTGLGTLLHAKLAPLLTFPFGGEIAAFLSALTTGIATLAITWSVIDSPAFAGLWEFLDKASHAHTLEQVRRINGELDHYLLELGRVEFNLDSAALACFAADLASGDDEIERSLLIGAEVGKRRIGLPFEHGDVASTRAWLGGLVQT